MSYPFYKTLHLAGVIMLFLAWGALLLIPRTKDAAGGPSRRLIMMTHGIALALLLVAGFGMLARLGIHWPWPGWVWAKGLVWLFLGGAVTITKRKPQTVSFFWWLIPLLGVSASFFAVYKPF